MADIFGTDNGPVCETSGATVWSYEWSEDTDDPAIECLCVACGRVHDRFFWRRPTHEATAALISAAHRAFRARKVSK